MNNALIKLMNSVLNLMENIADSYFTRKYDSSF